MRQQGEIRRIIVDGGLEYPGQIVVSMAGAAHGFMAGKYFVAASQSLSFMDGNARPYEDGLHVLSVWQEDAIKERRAKRYTEGKTAPEGKSGYVLVRGPLKSWIGKDKELIKNGFAHVWAKNIEEIHQYGTWPYAFRLFTPVGRNQIDTRIKDAK